MRKKYSEIEREDNDPVNHPKHYQLLGGKVEVKDIIQDRLTNLGHFEAYCYGNIIKYVLRAIDKDNFKQDLLKAKAYIDMIT